MMTPNTSPASAPALGRIRLTNLTVAELVERSLARGEASLTASGALRTVTSPRTGRSPKDKFVVRAGESAPMVWWGGNAETSPERFDALLARVGEYAASRDVFVHDGCAGADPAHRLRVRFQTEYAWHGLFVRQLFLRPGRDELEAFAPDFHVIAMPGFHADPARDGTNSEAFILLNFERRMVLIGGTKYAGEIKKSIFTVMNYLMPLQGVLPMHCSANVGPQDDVALFFGLSGTGKTTLSADPHRRLIGDDEHGWSDNGIFNFEGGCYAKCINLSRENEPQIWDAIRFGSVVENVVLDDRREPDFADASITENTRVGYPVDFIHNALASGMGGHPNHVVFLTADATGVLPPVSRLSQEQAMYHFLSGYTSRLAGTEAGVTEPTAVFSTCFGAPFLPLPPATYADMLGRRMEAHSARCWLVNTGWSGGAYGAGKRISLPHTRAIITAILNGMLDNAPTVPDTVFGIHVPVSVPGVPADILQPRDTWSDGDAYDLAARALAAEFRENFKRFEGVAVPVAEAGPKG